MKPEEVIKIIAEAAESLAENAGVGGMETAGMIISALHSHPELIPAFLERPNSVLIDGDLAKLHPENGCLSWHSKSDGSVITPEMLQVHLKERLEGRGVK